MRAPAIIRRMLRRNLRRGVRLLEVRDHGWCVGVRVGGRRTYLAIRPGASPFSDGWTLINFHGRTPDPRQIVL